MYLLKIADVLYKQGSALINQIKTKTFTKLDHIQIWKETITNHSGETTEEEEEVDTKEATETKAAMATRARRATEIETTEVAMETEMTGVATRPREVMATMAETGEEATEVATEEEATETAEEVMGAETTTVTNEVLQANSTRAQELLTKEFR